MFRLTDVERQLATRWRRLRGARAGAWAFAASSLLLLLLAAIHRFALPQTPPVPLYACALPILCAALAAGAGWARRPDLPRLLLQVDVALRTDERLSALHELREANRGRPFRKAIEATLQQDKFHWRGGLPLGAASPALAGLGVLALSAAAFLFSLGPAIRNAVGPGGSPPTAAVGFAPADRPAAAPAEVTPVPEQPAREASPLSGAPEQSLDDLLSGLWETPGSTGVLSEAGGDLGDLSRAVDQGAAALKELLAQIQRRLDESSGSMTEEERQRLSELVQSVPDTALRKALESLLNQTEDEGTRQALEKARQLAAQSGNQESAAAPEDASPTSPSSDEDETTRGVPTPPSQGAVGAATPEEVAEGNGQPSVGGQVGSAHEGPGEDWSSAGGTEAAPPSSGAEADRAPGPSASFLPADVAGIVGPDGDVRQFLTKGVPVEPPPEPTEAGADLRVDYENLRALLDSRSLPSGTQDSVRRYFQFVTQGGP